MLPEAPALFSTTTGCPSRFESASATTRPLVSVTPPGANGTTSRIGRSGYWAWAPIAAAANAAIRSFFIVFLLGLSSFRVFLLEFPDVLEAHQTRELAEILKRRGDAARGAGRAEVGINVRHR